jgi:hypothetical protein
MALNLRDIARRSRLLAGLVLLVVALAPPGGAGATMAEDEHTAAMLADMLRAVRTVVAQQQEVINDPTLGPKGLTGEVVLDKTIEQFEAQTGSDPGALEPGSRDARLMTALMDAIREIVDENQANIDAEGVGFKGFIPALVGRLVTARFNEKVGDEALMRVTAPAELVRNRTARPDEWEAQVITSRLEAADWPRGRVYAERASRDGREAFRALVPEYYTEGCLACHGQPAGEVDITGYPKEGGAVGQLGGAISITLFH